MKAKAVKCLHSILKASKRGYTIYAPYNVYKVK